MRNEKDELKRLMGKRIRELRKSLDLNQGQLADHLPCSRSNLSQVENGVFSPGVSILDALIKKFNVSLDWLFTGKGSMFIEEKENVRELLDFGKDTGEIEEMLKEMKKSPAIMHWMLSNFFTQIGFEKGRQDKKRENER